MKLSLIDKKIFVIDMKLFVSDIHTFHIEEIDIVLSILKFEYMIIKVFVEELIFEKNQIHYHLFMNLFIHFFFIFIFVTH